MPIISMGTKTKMMATWCNACKTFYSSNGQWATCSKNCVRNLAIRFWVRVRKTDTCWYWTGSLGKADRGRLRVNYKQKPASHVAWFLTHNEWPGTPPYVLHHCDNPNCVRPDHLWLGTARDNVMDAVRKGRHCHWETHGMSKLNKEKIVAIRIAFNELLRKFAFEYGVRTSTIRAAATNKRWQIACGKKPKHTPYHTKGVKMALRSDMVLKL